MKITFFWSSKNHCVLPHKRLGPKWIPGKLNSFAKKITLFWSSKNHCVLLHKRLGSKIIPGKPMVLLWNSPSIEALNTIAFYYTKHSGQKKIPENLWFCYENHLLLKLSHCVLLRKRLGSKLVPGKLNGFVMKITFFWSPKKPLRSTTQKIRVKNNSQKTSWFWYENHAPLKL